MQVLQILSSSSDNAPRRTIRFDPRPHARGDPRSAAVCGSRSRVSIHAPTRGATRERLKTSPSRKCFDPRPHARGDNPSLMHRPACPGFDPRPHARGDPQSCRLTHRQCRFDPRPHARGDILSRQDENLLQQFRSTPPREGRRAAAPAQGRAPVSIHAPTRGATAGRSPHVGARQGFDPRPHARGDAVSLSTVAPPEEFRSTPPREGRPLVDELRHLDDTVSIHAPTRGATPRVAVTALSH